MWKFSVIDRNLIFFSLFKLFFTKVREYLSTYAAKILLFNKKRCKKKQEKNFCELQEFSHTKC